MVNECDVVNIIVQKILILIIGFILGNIVMSWMWHRWDLYVADKNKSKS